MIRQTPPTLILHSVSHMKRSVYKQRLDFLSTITKTEPTIKLPNIYLSLPKVDYLYPLQL